MSPNADLPDKAAAGSPVAEAGEVVARPEPAAAPTAAAEGATASSDAAAAAAASAADSDGSDSDSDSCSSEEDELRCKMLLIVRKDLKMGKGKIGAQCGHATLGAFERAVKTPRGAGWVAHWQKFGQKKVCLQVSGEDELRLCGAFLADAGVPVYIVADAGHTQVDPGTETVLGAGPAPSAIIDAVTGPKGTMPLRLLN